MLKTQLHIHTKEDQRDPHLTYNVKDAIDKAKELNFDVIALTFHDDLFYNKKIVDYAKSKDILLIPGIEKTIEGGHVLILGLTELPEINNLQDLKKIKDKALIIAPHPFFPRGDSLKNKLVKNIDCFHGIEHSFYYARFLDFNRKAIKLAKKYKKPLLGTSDVHDLHNFNYTYTLVDAEKNIEDIINAIKNNKIEIKTRPLPFIKMSWFALFHIVYKFIVQNLSRSPKK